MSYQTIEHEAQVVAREELNAENILLELYAPALVKEAQIGQFVALETSTFLRRPLGIASVNAEAGTFKVGFHIKGDGTETLALLEPQVSLSVLGPLGTGFNIHGKTRALIVGGGTGVYPLLYTLEYLKSVGIKTAAAFGFRSQEQVILEADFRRASEHVSIALDHLDTHTDTREEKEKGPYIHGNAIHAAKAAIEAAQLFDAVDREETVILACGPLPMLLAVAAFAREKGIACQVSLEERMACGVGYCRTCSCKAKTGPGPDDWDYERVCVEGPVFPAERVFYD